MFHAPTDRVRVVRGDGDWPARLARASRHDVLKEDGHVRVARVEVEGRWYVVKCARARSTLDRAKALVGASRLARQWRGTAWLAGHGFATSDPLALLRGRRDSGFVECLVMESLAGPTLLELMARVAGRRAEAPADRPGVAEQHRLARALGEQVARLALRGRYNRDHKPSNLIVTRLDRREADVAIIDCVAIRRLTPISGDGVSRMLASLLIEAVGVGCPPRRALRMRAVESCARALGDGASRRALWRRAEAIVRAHPDPRPRVDPLG